MRKVTPSGFLNNHSQLQQGAQGEALLIYRNSNIDFSKYDSILLEPIVVYATEGSALGDLSAEKTQALIDYFYAKLSNEIGSAYKLAGAKGPKTATIRVALTDAKASSPFRDLMSNVMPYGLALSVIKRAALGTHTAVGHAQAEIQVIDSLSGELIFAAVDARAGRKTLRGKFDKWRDVKDAFDDWSHRIGQRLKSYKKEY